MSPEGLAKPFQVGAGGVDTILAQQAHEQTVVAQPLALPSVAKDNKSSLAHTRPACAIFKNDREERANALCDEAFIPLTPEAIMAIGRILSNYS